MQNSALAQSKPRDHVRPRLPEAGSKSQSDTNSHSARSTPNRDHVGAQLAISGGSERHTLGKVKPTCSNLCSFWGKASPS